MVVQKQGHRTGGGHKQSSNKSKHVCTYVWSAVRLLFVFGSLFVAFEMDMIQLQIICICL